MNCKLLLLCGLIAAATWLAQSTVAQPADNRPRVLVYSVPGCPACERFGAWSRTRGAAAAFRFDVRPAPAWVAQFPAFHFERPGGDWAVLYGWTSIDDFTRRWEAANR